MVELTQRIDIPVDWPDDAKQAVTEQWDRANALEIQLETLQSEPSYRIRQEQAERIVELETRLITGKQLVADLIEWIMSDELIGENEGSWLALSERAKAFREDRAVDNLRQSNEG